jgi:Bacterial toxin YdaS
MRKTHKSSGAKPAAKNAPSRRRPTGAGPKPGRRRTAGQSPRLRKVLALLPQPELAKVCGVKRQAIQQWRDVPPQHALAIEKATGGKLTKEFLAPSFYPRPAA